MRSANSGSQTSDFDDNYQQLYNKRQKKYERTTETTFLDEDIGDSSTDNSTRAISQTNHKGCQTNIEPNGICEDKFVLNPNYIIPQPEFKWNPVISTRRNSPLSWLRSHTASEPVVYEQYESSYHDESFVREHFLPEHEFSQFPEDFPVYGAVQEQTRSPCNCKTRTHESHRNLAPFSCSPDKWDTSSASSGQTIAEVSNLLIQYSVQLL